MASKSSAPSSSRQEANNSQHSQPVRGKRLTERCSNAQLSALIRRYKLFDVRQREHLVAALEGRGGPILGTFAENLTVRDLFLLGRLCGKAEAATVQLIRRACEQALLGNEASVAEALKEALRLSPKTAGSPATDLIESWLRFSTQWSSSDVALLLKVASIVKALESKPRLSRLIYESTSWQIGPTIEVSALRNIGALGAAIIVSLLGHAPVKDLPKYIREMRGNDFLPEESVAEFQSALSEALSILGIHDISWQTNGPRTSAIATVRITYRI